MLKLRAPVYEAAMTVAPAARDVASAGRLAAELEQYAGFATLAQSTGAIEPVSTLDRYLALLTSTRVAERLADDPALLKALFGGEQGGNGDGWKAPDDPVSRIKQAVARFFGFPARPEPGPPALAALLTERLVVRGTAGIYRITLSDQDPALALQILTGMHEAADALLRDEALAVVRAQIDEIEAQLEQVGDPARRQALEALLASHYQSEALLDIDQAYAAELIDPPSASGWPTSMHPILFLVLAGVVGTILGIFVVFLRDALRSGRA